MALITHHVHDHNKRSAHFYRGQLGNLRLLLYSTVALSQNRRSSSRRKLLCSQKILTQIGNDDVYKWQQQQNLSLWAFCHKVSHAFPSDFGCAKHGNMKRPFEIPMSSFHDFLFFWLQISTHHSPRFRKELSYSVCFCLVLFCYQSLFSLTEGIVQQSLVEALSDFIETVSGDSCCQAFGIQSMKTNNYEASCLSFP